jgi:16S rRNA (uracil1498-N3)-methyltransferase
MRRYWLETSSINGNEVTIEGEKFKHIVGVCRQEVGSKFEVIVGDGKAYFLELVEVGKKSAKGIIKDVRNVPELKKPHIYLCLSIPRFNRLDEIVEKSVELGVHTLIPFFSDYSFVRKPDPSFLSRYKRLERIVESATQQSGRGELMKISEPIALGELLRTFNRKTNAAGLFPYEGETQVSIQDALKAISPSNCEEVWVFVGSEGGFSLDEVQQFQAVNLTPATLGDQILRVETACVTLVSILKYHLSVS